ncbi:hypothetical protein GCM10010464_29190 [Pseudonocardia yunnanensis]|uniref:Uncharacterized protein n=1 Tax=Pseudonocardia yunnanensis TaxID=58107 RepID=A0ABW4EYM6_9PSEU
MWELVAGTFAVHSREDDLGGIRRSAEQVVHRYEEAEERQRLVAETLERSPAGGRAVVGLRDPGLWAGATAAVGQLLNQDGVVLQGTVGS